VSHLLTVSRERTTGQYSYKYCSHDVASIHKQETFVEYISRGNEALRSLSVLY